MIFTNAGGITSCIFYWAGEMGLYVWRSSVPTGYSQGVIIVEAQTVDEARNVIIKDIDRWLKHGEDEGSPCWYDFDKEGNPWTGIENWDDHDQKEYDDLKSRIISDIAKDPMSVPETKVIWIPGGG